MRLRVMSGLAALVVLAGCATPNQFANAVVDANVTQELAHNRLVLLNIVRAYKRMPMHFSKMTAARVPVGIGNPTFTMPTPFGPESLVLRYDWQTALGIQQGVDSTPLDSQEFIRGMTTPVSATTMLHYLDQGWPQQMILQLFVRSIEVFEKHKDGSERLVERFVNYPHNSKLFADFRQAIRGLAGCEIDSAFGAPTPYGPTFDADKLGNLEALAAARNADFQLLPVDNEGKEVKKPEQKTVGYRLFRDQRLPGLRFTASSKEDRPCLVPGDSEQRVAAGVSLNAMVNADGRKQTVSDPNPRTAVYLLRSPEAMLYHLGEIGRVQLDDGEPELKVAYRQDRSVKGINEAALFQLLRGAGSNAAVSVDHEGETFSIPKSTPGNRSMHVVSLLTQLIGLHNKGNEAPATLNVRSVP
jgi:hypothetical protein